MNPELEQLKAIVTGEGFDNDSREEVVKLEEALKEAIAAKKLGEHPAIKSYLDWVRSEIWDCKMLLADEDEPFDTTAQNRLRERIKQCKQTLRAFGGKQADIELLIKQKLNHAKSLT